MRLPVGLALPALGLSAPAAAQTAPDDTLRARADALVTAFLAGDDAGTTRHFDAAMRAALPPERLATIRAQIAPAGPLRARGPVRLEPAEGLRAGVVRLAYAPVALDVRVVFGADGSVAGLFFAPAAPAPTAPAGPPPYADTTAYRESPLVLTRPGAADLPGVLTMPTPARGPAGSRGRVPAVVLVHGSGPHDADETVGGTRVFRDLAAGLATRGIAVFRYEKRTHAHPEAFAGRAFTTDEETTDDAVAALALLRRTAGVDPRRVAVVGHSLGGLLAPEIARRDGRVAGAALLAGSPRPLPDIVYDQAVWAGRADTTAAGRARLRAARAHLDTLKALPPTLPDTAVVDGVPAAYWRGLARYDAGRTARALGVPLLVAQGGRDVQVTRADYDAWRAALGPPRTVTYAWFDALNHLFVAGTGPGSVEEYATPAHVDAAFVEALARWVAALPPRR